MARVTELEEKKGGAPFAVEARLRLAEPGSVAEVEQSAHLGPNPLRTGAIGPRAETTA
jgi:hypothetical protein